ncbi:transcription antitermination factor NusB [Desulfuromonas sp. CSMB_57]|uniref:transcription antitermination factor NusB n=1 Tax=Desulfuromonas sp. CSMB_57 TaxID=2807629 RepID=UPI0024BEFD26|nr:transcription antitermination factor NusB [Desulfuromonas sp. CSMB_57]
MSIGVRRSGRELAVKIIYSLDHAPEGSVDDVLGTFWGHFRFQDNVLGEPLEEEWDNLPITVVRFAEELVRGVAAHRPQLDEAIKEYSTNWSLERMSRVDLAILRLAAFELLFQPDVPASVAINEAVEIGKRYGTKDTPAFVNGILDKIAKCRLKAEG